MRGFKRDLAATFDLILYACRNFRLIGELIVAEFHAAYMSSYLGAAWAILQPLGMLCVLWVVFSFGLRAGNAPNGVPFFLWLACGILPWLFIADGLKAGTNSIVSKAFLVKKVAFRISILPVVSLGSASIIHGVLIIILLAIALLYGVSPTIFWLQFFYYFFAALVLLLAASWLTSTLVIFLRDVQQVIGVAIQFGFWVTPVMWPAHRVPEQHRWIVEINPAAYIVEGFRDCLFGGRWFWERGVASLVFWLVTLALLICGGTIFRRLRPHFSDVI